MIKKFSKNLLISVGLLAAISIGTAANATNILFGYVGTDYHGNGEGLAGFLTADGHAVTEVNLYNTLLGDISSYDQVWVYDLS